MLMLDEVMDRLMAGTGTEKDRGEALGLAKAINECCYLGVDRIREYAMYRWEARQEGLGALSMYEWARAE